MWTPKPKGKVTRRPKLTLKQRSPQAGVAEAVKQEKRDPHREVRYFGVKHSDITRIFFVDSTNSIRESPVGPFEKKQTDITAYLEHAVPCHASQTASGNGTIVRVRGRRHELGDIRACYPCRLPSACNDCRSVLREQPAPPGSQQNENIRPTTAPTGEMRKLYATAASPGRTSVPSIIRSGTAGSKRSSYSRAAGSVCTTSRPGTRDPALGSAPCSTKGSVLGSTQCSSWLRTCGTLGSRLQSVPE